MFKQDQKKENLCHRQSKEMLEKMTTAGIELNHMSTGKFE
jgi:hypothetical protein